VGFGARGMIRSVRVVLSNSVECADISPSLMIPWSNKSVDVTTGSGVEDDSLFVLFQSSLKGMSGAGTITYHYQYINVSSQIVAE